MSVIRTVWSKAYADNFDDIFRKPATSPRPEISNVRYAGVCQCDIVEHCAKCDPDFFKVPYHGTYDPSIGDNLGVPHTDACKKIGKVHSGECPV